MERQYDYSSLRNYVEDAKQWHINKYDELNWQWYDEGLIYSICDYESSVPIEDWTNDDFEYLKEWKLTREDIESILLRDKVYSYNYNDTNEELVVYENDAVLATISEVKNEIVAEELFYEVVFEMRGIELI